MQDHSMKKVALAGITVVAAVALTAAPASAAREDPRTSNAVTASACPPCLQFAFVVVGRFTVRESAPRAILGARLLQARRPSTARRIEAAARRALRWARDRSARTTRDVIERFAAMPRDARGCAMGLMSHPGQTRLEAALGCGRGIVSARR